MSEFDYDPQGYIAPYLPWEPDERPPRSELNPYGFWNGKVGNEDSPMCRYTEPLYLCSLCGDETTPDPTGWEKWAVMIFHWLTFPVGIFALWCIYVKIDVLQKRIYSPFLLLVAILNLTVGSMAEIDNHYFSMNWNACYDSGETLAKLYFYVFVGSGNALLMIAPRKVNVPLWRKPSGCCDWYFFLGDWLLIFFTIAAPLVWIFVGQLPATTMFIVAQCAGALIGVPRIYSNLGPSRLHLVLGTLSQVSAFAGAVPINIYLQNSGWQFIHCILAFQFVFTVGSISYCIYRTQKPAIRLVVGEETPLV